MLASAIFAPVESRAASAYPQRESFKADPFEYARRGLEIGGRTSAGCAKYLAEGEERFERRNFSPSGRSFSPRTRFFRFYVSIEATSRRRSRFSKESPLVPEERCSSDEIFPQVAVCWASFHEHAATGGDEKNGASKSVEYVDLPTTRTTSSSGKATRSNLATL